MVNVGDRYIFHSSNGMNYSIEIVNINDSRELSMKYGADVYDGNNIYAGDIIFLDDAFLNKCKKVN